MKLKSWQFLCVKVMIGLGVTDQVTRLKLQFAGSSSQRSLLMIMSQANRNILTINLWECNFDLIFFPTSRIDL